ncbi:MAG: hypothetical protein ACYTG0_22160 [Planctomycetota bacterium]|jgi:hypothetical protein
MRRMIRVLAGLLVLAALATGVAASEPQPTMQPTLAGYGPYGVYGAGACCAPGYGLVPGCCEWAPNCCDDVWAGYCQRKRCGWGGRWGGGLRSSCAGVRQTAPCCPATPVMATPDVPTATELLEATELPEAPELPES